MTAPPSASSAYELKSLVQPFRAYTPTPLKDKRSGPRVKVRWYLSIVAWKRFGRLPYRRGRRNPALWVRYSHKQQPVWAWAALNTPRHSMTPQLYSTLSLPDLVHLWLLADRHSSTLTPQNNPFPRRRREPTERRIASDSHRDQSPIICAVSDEPRATPSLTPEFHASGYVTS